MARFEVEFKRSVAKDVRGIPAPDLKRILQKIDSLRDDPRPPGSTKLSGQECYRIRQGDYRILYEIIENRLVIIVIRIGNRKEVYR